ncbi:MAG: uroporphyrinogen-III C-methyltransferase [Bacillota bacterium]|nr:uroporphyrinogen-III C-methyltransferase [Clostridia bacterium]
MTGDRKKVYLVGAGPGDYGLITLKGIECLKLADVVIYDRLVNKRYLDFAREDAEKIYVGKKSSFHSLPQHQINALLVEKAKEGKTVVRLKGGDPCIFGRGGEEAEELAKEGITFEFVPGITSAAAVPAYAGIPITHRDFVSSVHIITGHEKHEKDVSNVDYSLLAKLQGTLVFLMGLANLGNICTSLIKNGMPEESPVAVISQGTTSRQKKIIGNLKDIQEKVKRAKLIPPAIIVVGKVVKLHDKLDWFLKKPLSGKKILVTRTRSQASVLAQKIEELGGEVYTFPTIKIAEPLDHTAIDSSLNKIKSYHWIVFTSVNGVEAFFKRLQHQKLDIRSLHGVMIAAIGVATSRALEEKGVIPDFVPDKFQAETLAAGLKERISKGQRVLLPTADIARRVLEDELRSIGAQVEKIDLYRTIPGEGERDTLLEWLANGEIDIITFTSSSTVRNFIKILGRENIPLLKQVKVACIGPVTADTAKKLGLKVEIEAKEFTIDGLVQAIVEP